MIDDDLNFQVVNNAFPHLGKKIRLFWGYPELPAMMLELQQNTRDTPRQGFPIAVLTALIALEERHDRDYPRLKRQILSNWHTL
jgi:hypothetical protein